MHLPSDACCGGRRRGDSAQADSTRQAPGLECFPLCFAQVLSVSWFCFLSFPDGVLSPSSESPDLGMVWGPCCRSVLLPLASVHLGICRGSPTSLSLRLHPPSRGGLETAPPWALLGSRWHCEPGWGQWRVITSSPLCVSVGLALLRGFHARFVSSPRSPATSARFHPGNLLLCCHYARCCLLFCGYTGLQWTFSS